MNIEELYAIEGPNIYSPKPVIRMIIDIGKWEYIPTKDIRDFNKTLLNYLPGLKEHHCSYDMPGGFLRRLDEGTYMPHVIEHTALELLNLAGQDVSFGKARRIEGTEYAVIFSYKEKNAAKKAAKIAVELLKSIASKKPYSIDDKILELKRITAYNKLGPSTDGIAKEARKLGLPVTRIGDGSFLILGYGASQKRVMATIGHDTSCIGVDVACDKQLTKRLLEMAGILVPEGKVVYTEDEAVNVAQKIGFPVIIKPCDLNQGKGVCLNIKDTETVKRAFDFTKKYSSRIIVERQIKGRNFRVLIVDGKFVCAAERIPAHVIGDGVHTVRELIEIENKNPLRGKGHEKPLTKIKIDEGVKMVLFRQNLSLDKVPVKGIKVFCRENGNLSNGGIAIDVTDEICEENKRTAQRAAQILDLDIAGVDITVEDISKPLSACDGAVIEVNAAPGIRMHLYPSKGKVRPAAKAIVDMLFPKDVPEFPIIAVTGTNGKTTTVRMINKVLSGYGLLTGMTSSDGVYIGDECIKEGDCSGPESARMVLFDPNVQAAVLEIARGGLIRKGLGYDKADVGIITNITEDHLGQDGVNTLDDMVFVKTLVAEQIKKGGHVVLNADDAMIIKTVERIKNNIIFFSTKHDNILLKEHISRGGCGVYIKNDIIVIEKEDIKGVMKVSDIPATLGGKALHNIENALAAVAGCYALDIPVGIISRELKKFSNDPKNNPGRMNIYDFERFKVILDYGHNKESVKSIINTAKTMKPSRLIGVIASPGDRRDKDIKGLGYLAGKNFSHLIIKEDEDLRGRFPGEVAAILEEGAIDAGLEKSVMDIVLKEEEAVQFAIEKATPGDIVVIFYENYQKAKKVVLESAKNMKKLIKAANSV